VEYGTVFLVVEWVWLCCGIKCYVNGEVASMGVMSRLGRMQGLVECTYICTIHLTCKTQLHAIPCYGVVYIVITWKHLQFDMDIRSRCVQRKLGAARQVDVLSLCQRIRFDLLP
jgi:hypothetical protein